MQWTASWTRGLWTDLPLEAAGREPPAHWRAFGYEDLVAAGTYKGFLDTRRGQRGGLSACKGCGLRCSYELSRLATQGQANKQTNNY